MQVPFAPRGTRIISGFFHPGTHDIVPFDDCPVQSELSMQAGVSNIDINPEKTSKLTINADDMTPPSGVRPIEVATHLPL